MTGKRQRTENGKVKRKKKENLNNRMALIGITLVVLSLAVTVHTKGIDVTGQICVIGSKIKEENLMAQDETEKKRSEQLEEYRVYVQTKQYIEKVAKEKLGLVNKDEVLLKPAK